MFPCCSCFVYMSANKYVCLHVGLCFYPSTCLSVNQSISSSLSVGRFSCGSSYLSIFLSVYSPAFRPTDLSVCLFVGRPVHRHITDLLFTVPLVNTHTKKRCALECNKKWPLAPTCQHATASGGKSIV